MSRFEVKGWCPGALRPMPSGDGLVVRVRPHLGRLSAAQAAGLADAAERYGSGFIDLSARANLQLRGVTGPSHARLLAALDELGLLDPDPQTEQRRNVCVSPFWREGDETRTIAAALERALSPSGLQLPGKFGFAVDCGPERVLARASADIRIERGATGGLIVRADGAHGGRPVDREQAVPTSIALAEWFAATGGIQGGRGRMAAHIAGGVVLPPELSGNHDPASCAPPPQPGCTAYGVMVAMPFGQVHAHTLRALASVAPELRMTPWRMIYLPGLIAPPAIAELIIDPEDPLLKVEACTGAPGCPQALAETRPLARSLAPYVPPGARLHVSGCAKGCAHPGAAPVALVATKNGFDLVRDGTASATPALRGIPANNLAADPATYLRAK